MAAAHRSKPAWRIVGGAGLACAAAWLLPQSKPEAVLGRLNYWQFLLAVVTTGLFLTAAGLALVPQRRTIAFRVAAVWLSVTVALLLCEGVAFMLPARHLMDNPWYFVSGAGGKTADLPFERPPYLHWEGLSRGDMAILNDDADPYAKQVVFETDFEGFRNGSNLHQADLIFVGDSYTEAGNVSEEETFVKLTGTQLGLTARNLGRASYSTPMELIVLKKYGLPCRPRLVVWQIAEANDLVEAVMFQKWVDSGRPANLTMWTPRPPSRLDSWLQRSPTWKMFQTLRSPKVWHLKGKFRDRDGGIHEIRFLAKPGPNHTPGGNPGWPIMEESLREGATILKREKIKLVVMLIPMKPRGMGPAVEGWESMGDIPPESTLATYLKNLCAKLGIAFVDVTQVLQEGAAAGNLLYFPFDTHFTPEGHRLVSKTLVDVLSGLDETQPIKP